MEIVFMGTPDFAVVSLLKLIHSEHEIVLVVTVPDKPQGRGQKVKPSPVKKVALQNCINVLQPEKLEDPVFIDDLSKKQADIFVVVAFRILPESVFTIPVFGTVNVHASLLPKYRGAAPINWAIINGEHETGVTTMFINEKVDTGNILLQDKMSIDSTMDAGQLHDALAGMGGNLLLQTLNLIGTGSIELKFQNESLATKAPKLKKAMCHLNFHQPIEKVYNLIRGLSPYPGAFCYHQNKLIKFYRSKISTNYFAASEPGTVVDVMKESFTISCLDGAIEILEVQLEGKKRLKVNEFFNGYHIKIGDILG